MVLSGLFKHRANESLLITFNKCRQAGANFREVPTMLIGEMEVGYQLHAKLSLSPGRHPCVSLE
jgi:hypothetical protein